MQGEKKEGEIISLCQRISKHEYQSLPKDEKKTKWKFLFIQIYDQIL